MGRGATTARRVVVIGPPGAGGEHVVHALARAGFVDASDELAAHHDALLAAEDATRLVPPPEGVVARADSDQQAEATAEPSERPSVAYDDATALVLSAPPDDDSSLYVVVWCEPRRSVAALAPRGIGAAHAVALWNRSVRAAGTALAGRRVVVVDGEALAGAGTGRSQALAPLFDGLGIAGPADEAPSAPPAPPATALGAGADPSAADLGLTAPEPGWHDAWAPPPAAPAPPWCEELLGAAWRAHRALLEAREAWQALDEHRRAAPTEDPAVAAARERDTLRLRDRVIGLEGELGHVRSQLAAAEADRDATAARSDELERRVAALEHDLAAARDELDRMAASWQWKAGGVVVAPVRRARRMLGPS